MTAAKPPVGLGGPGFVVRDDGRLMYSFRSLCEALSVDCLPGTPTVYEDKAMEFRDSDPIVAATLYLAAAVVSAGLSRTLAYEAAAEDLVRRFYAAQKVQP